jgi:hypothetical protein
MCDLHNDSPEFKVLSQKEIDRQADELRAEILNRRDNRHDLSVAAIENDRRKLPEGWERAGESSIAISQAEDRAGEDAGGSTPHQYGLPQGATELQDLIEYREMNFSMGNIFKACYRTGACDHSSRQRDLRKIIWFAQRELNRIS